MGAKNIYLYVSHCESNIFRGDFTDKHIPLLQTGLIKNVFTTNSIYNCDDINVIVHYLSINSYKEGE